MSPKFPFENKRLGQEEMIKKVEYCLENRKNLLIHAPTGIGKTVSALYPAVKFASKRGLNVFFLTPRHSQHIMAIETLRKIGNVSVMNIIGKMGFCNNVYEGLSSGDFHEMCNYLKKDGKCKFYNKVYNKGKVTDEAKAKVRELSADILTSEEMKGRCRDFCPYEIACLGARKSTVVVADYFHLFNPFISDTFLAKIDKKLEDSIIIVDEAHQLPGRSRDLISSKLTSYILNRAVKEAKDVQAEISSDLEDFQSAIENLKGKIRIGDEGYISKSEININSFGLNFLERLKETADLVIEEGKERSHCLSILDFLERWMNSDEQNFTRIIRKKPSRYGEQVEVKISALLPSEITSDIINNSYSTILMSATLQPLEMYSDLLGVKNYESVSLKSAFPKENRLNLIAPIATTKYSRRGDAQYKNYADIIKKIFDSVGGNTAVFFPSYFFLHQVENYLDRGINCFKESQELSKEQKNQMLEDFIKSKNSLLMGVQSGSFDQGIDFPNNSLKCTIVAGIALATPDLETKSVVACYNRHYGKGMEYGYIYPAVQKVVQAAGRAIRSETDKAVVVYLDERFMWRNYIRALSGENFKVSRAPWIDIKDWKGVDNKV